MGGSGGSLPRVSPGSGTSSGSAGSGGQGTSGGDGKPPCPSGFEAEVSDIPSAMQQRAGELTAGQLLEIELRDGDPVFVLGGEVLGWLATNIEEVTRCLNEGWRYRAEVTSVASTAAGTLLMTRVDGSAS